MVEIIPRLFVSSYNDACCLFTAEPAGEASDSATTDHGAPDSIENIGAAVFTVCQDVPYWCSHRRLETTAFPIKNAALAKLYEEHCTNSYVGLHFDRVYTTDDLEEVPQAAGKCVFVAHSIIPADDKPDEEFYRAFQFAYELIDYVLARDSGYVFIHCLLGMCRSTSLCCAYLMRRWNKPFLEVKRHIKGVHPKAAISHYFEYQMILYHRNNFQIKDGRLFFKYYASTLDAHLRNRHNMHLQADPDPQFLYSCKLCRETLFCDTNVMGHKPPGGGAECNSLFIEPMTWMSGLEDQNGKLFCANAACSSKLGAFSWHGRKCSCGHLQVPAFQVQLSKVDRFDYAEKGNMPSKNEDLQVK